MPASRSPGDAGDKPSLWDRLRLAMLRPDVDDGDEAAKKPGRSVEELQAEVKSANDKERAVGLVAAPLAGGIGILVINALIDSDPAPGAHNHVAVSVYHELAFVLIGLAVLILFMALFRKRLFMGIALALYGLAIFNLHYWGFGVPFVLVGAWLLVRTYRLQRDLKAATEENSARPKRAGNTPSPAPSKRYTPPTAPPKRAPGPSPEKEQRAG